MAAPTERYDFDRVFRLLITLLSVGGTIWLLLTLSSVLVPFAVAVLLAYLLNPVVNAFEDRTGSRGIAVALTLAVLSVFLVVTIPLVGWLVVKETLDVLDVLKEGQLQERVGREAIAPFLDWFSNSRFKELIATQFHEFVDNLDHDKIQQHGTRVLSWAWEQVRAVWGTGLTLLGGVVNTLLACSVLIVIFLYLVFLMLDFNSFQKHWKDHLPPTYRESIVLFVEEFSNAMGRYFRGQFLVAMGCGVLFAIGFKIVGLRMAVVLGLFVGLLNMVPYLQTIGIIPAVLLALLRAFETGGSPLPPLVGTLVVFAVVQLIQDAVLVPRIMGESTGLKPWVILLSIFVWGRLLGFLGLVLAIPLSCLGLAYYRRSILRLGSNSAGP